ncbi:hypothetical protein ACHAP5_004918 [Fusarium lateritium]
MTAIEGMKVELSNDLVSPRTVGIEKSLDVLLSLPKKYDYSPVVKHHEKSLNLQARRHPLVWSLIARHSTQGKILMITNLPQEEYTRQEATSVCEMLLEILNRWPAPLNLLTKSAANFKSGSFHARLLTLACRHKLFPLKPVICALPTFMHAKTGKHDGGVTRGPHFSLWVSCIHPTTYKQRDDKKLAGPRLFGPEVSVPEPSERYQFVAYDTRGGIKQSISKVSSAPGQPATFLSLLPNEDELHSSSEERKSLQNAERILRLYSATISNQGGLIDAKGSSNIWNNLVEKHGGVVSRKDPGASRGIFGGSDLLQVYALDLLTRIEPGVTVERKLRETNKNYRLPGIIIRSRDRAWVIGVEQAISDAWLLEGDILKAWSRGAEVADQVNQSIRDLEKAPSSCVCTPEMSKTQTHPCSHCGIPYICSQLVRTDFDDRRVCTSCSTRLHQRPLGSHILENFSYRLSNTLLFEQRRSRGIITDAEKAVMFEQGLDTIKGMLPSKDAAAQVNLPIGSTWRNVYSGHLHSLTTDNSAATRTQPDRPSIDAIFPAWLTSFGYRIHCPGNLATTLQAINYAKHIQIPAFLAMICWYEQERTSIEHKYKPNVWGASARAEFDVLEAKMVRISKRLRTIRLTFGWSKLRRLCEKDTSIEKFRLDLAPLISGQPHLELQESMERLDTVQNFARHAPEIGLPERDLARLRTLVQEIQDFFEVQLPRGSDGCPYFAHPDSMPEVWNWRIAFRLSYERLQRMKTACNRRWPTYDTVETIFLECIFQVCVVRCVLKSDDEFYELKAHLKSKYASILGLPLTIAYHDGLTFAVGHAHHGKGMFTGWPPKAHRLDERLDADETNNIRIEPRTENFLKADYDESTYSQLKKMIMEIDLPKSVYDKNLKPDKLSKQDLENLRWDGEELDDADLFGETVGLFDSEFIQQDEREGPEAMPGTQEEASMAVKPSTINPSAKSLGKMAVRVKSNETDYGEGLSVDEWDRLGSEVMSGKGASKHPDVPKRFPSRIPSVESRYSEGLSPGAIEQQWSEAMSGGMDQRWSQLMDTIESRSIDVSADRGFQNLVDSLREAKEKGDDAGFTAVLAVIEMELGVI